MRRALVLGLLLLAIPMAAAGKWTTVQSQNFLLVGNASESEIRDLGENLELFRTAYSKFFPLRESASSVGTTVVLFKSDSAFRPYKPLYQGKPVNIAGYFQGGPDMNYIALSAEIETPRVIYHEYVHRLMSDNLSSLPPWFQEGFAECFSTLEIEGRDRKIRMGRAIAEHVELLNNRRFMPLEQLFGVTDGSPEYNEEDKQGIFYAESWALVHYMMLGPQERRAKFFEFLSGLNKGTPAPAVFQRVFQTDLASFQKLFEAYIQQRMAWPALEISSPGRLDRNKDMTVRTLSEAESEFFLGDLLLHSSSLPEAELHLKNAVRLDPLLANAQAAMGRLLLKQNKESEAVAYLRHSIELDPGNYLAHYYYASSTQHGSRALTDAEWTIARTELLKAIELAPQFVAATEMLANLSLTRDTDIPQTVEILRKARTYAPGDDNLAVMLAFALARTPQREEARALARVVLLNSSVDPTMRENAESVLNFLNRFPANRSIRGILTLVDCKDGVTLSLTVEGKTVKLHSATLTGIRFTPASPIGCGPLPGNGVAAFVIYRPEESADSVGEPLTVELGQQTP